MVSCEFYKIVEKNFFIEHPTGGYFWLPAGAYLLNVNHRNNRTRY